MTKSRYLLLDDDDIFENGDEMFRPSANLWAPIPKPWIGNKVAHDLNTTFGRLNIPARRLQKETEAKERISEFAMASGTEFAAKVKSAMDAEAALRIKAKKILAEFNAEVFEKIAAILRKYCGGSKDDVA
jgi:hypothetical protein